MEVAYLDIPSRKEEEVEEEAARHAVDTFQEVEGRLCIPFVVVVVAYLCILYLLVVAYLEE